MTAAVSISKIDIQNYRSCVDASFSPTSGLSALIGPNGSGKTTILSALRLLSALPQVRSYRSNQRTTVDPYSTDCALRVHFECGKYKVIYEAQISLIQNDRNEDEIRSAVESWYLHSVTGSRKRAPIPMSALVDFVHYPQGIRRALTDHLEGIYNNPEATKKIVVMLQDINNYVQSITYYSASIFTNPSSSPISFEVEVENRFGSRRGISITGHKKFLYDLYLSSKDDQSTSYATFIDIVGDEGIGLIDKLSFQEIETSNSVYQVSVGGRISTRQKRNSLIIPNFTISNRSLSPSQLSEGTFKALALIFYIIADRGSLMMIEEPEVCVHHGLLSSIIELVKLYSVEKQIIISTHSDQLLDHLSIDSVFKVERGETGTVVSSVKKSLSAQELSAIKDYLRNEGGLGEYWKHGEL